MVLLSCKRVITLLAGPIHYHFMVFRILYLKFDWLLRANRLNKSAYELEGGIHSVFEDFFEVWHGLVDHNLQVTYS